MAATQGYGWLSRRLPRFLYRYLWHFESRIVDEVTALAQRAGTGARVLDAGAGEGQYRGHFAAARYIGADLGIGDTAWDYRGLDVVCDLCALPFPDGVFDACLNIVTLEHVRRPDAVLREISRTLRPGGQLLLVAPQDWQVHQSPHDYFRYTRHGLQYLLESAGFVEVTIEPGGGYFRLMGRRMLNGLEYFPGPLKLLAAALLLPLGVLFPLFDGLDSRRDFTLGYFCRAVKR
ncbi:MAG: class I SAM-dependent methyltransferase [Bryobacterales bacterium]|nr:class I SAM-dependent methyltransferase [Bryobacterales bacterium]